MYIIKVFDDGNEKYKIYHNLWEKYNSYLGKISLRNVKDPSVIIKSISQWKCIIPYTEQNPFDNPNEPHL